MLSQSKIRNFKRAEKITIMKKILVTTDFSEASKSAIRFAIQWSTQQQLQLVFINVHHVMKPTAWSKTEIEAHEANELRETDARLKEFVTDVYKETGIEPGNIDTKVIEGLDADVTILYHADKNSDYDCICISTRGAGKLKKMLGTNTGNLITKSDIPVMAIPAEYRASQIKSVMYASDMEDFKEEARKVVEFARPIDAKIEMMHYAWPNEFLFNEDMINDLFKKELEYDVDFHYEENDAQHSLIERLEDKIKERNPSVVVMFTNRQRTFFQKIFLSSKSEELSFKTKIPLLVFNKELVSKKEKTA